MLLSGVTLLLPGTCGPHCQLNFSSSLPLVGLCQIDLLLIVMLAAIDRWTPLSRQLGDDKLGIG